MENTQQGLQNQMFGVFVFLFVLVQLVMQVIPSFVTQRTLYEARERQSKTYAWQAFVFSNIAVEFAWNTVCICCPLLPFDWTLIQCFPRDYGHLLFHRVVLSRRLVPECAADRLDS